MYCVEERGDEAGVCSRRPQAPTLRCHATHLWIGSPVLALADVCKLLSGCYLPILSARANIRASGRPYWCNSHFSKRDAEKSLEDEKPFPCILKANFDNSTSGNAYWRNFQILCRDAEELFDRRQKLSSYILIVRADIRPSGNSHWRISRFLYQDIA